MNLEPTLIETSAAHAPVISRIIGRAVRTACAADHRNDPRLIRTWLRSTGPIQILRQLARPQTLGRLALLQGKPVGVAIAHADGEILHCYVLPEYNRRGVGTALIMALEDCLVEHGQASACLGSTAGGCGFYRRLGYSETNERVHADGLTLTLMEKSLLRPAMDNWTAQLAARA